MKIAGIPLGNKKNQNNAENTNMGEFDTTCIAHHIGHYYIIIPRLHCTAAS